jgi:DNA-binding transcriptional ArsR family regulator
VRTIHHPSIDDVELSHVLHALSDPVRLEIVRHLAEHPNQTCGSLDPGVAKSTLSHHLKVLREAGITRVEVDGTQRLVSLRSAEIEQRFPGLLASVLEAAEPSQAA